MPLRGKTPDAMFFKGSVLLTLAASVAAQSCSSSGVDIQDGGTYFIDNSSAASFSFISLFTGSGCSAATSISPILLDTSGVQHSCSSISESTGVDEESAWWSQSHLLLTIDSALLHSGMSAGTYTISLGGDVNMERVFTVVNSMATATTSATVTESDTATSTTSEHFLRLC